MTRYTDGKRMVEISITGRNGIDWENDFYEVPSGPLEETADVVIHFVDDVDYLIEQAEDLFYCRGDYAGCDPKADRNEVFVCEGNKVLLHLVPED